MKDKTQEIKELLQEKVSPRKYKYTAYHLYKHLGFSEGTVKLLALKIRSPHKYIVNRRKFRMYQRRRNKHEKIISLREGDQST